MAIILNKLSDPLSAKMSIIKEFGHVLNHKSKLLDYGGEGKMVEELCDYGYQAFGCDVKFIAMDDFAINSMLEKGIIRRIEIEPYRLPFKDNTFNFIFSHSVFEHVQNYSESISEMARVLKPGGVCLHLFPSRNRLIEPHIYVPLASRIKSFSWIYFWTLLGIRNEFTGDLNAKEASILFYNYIKNETNYLSRKQLMNHFREQFKDVRFCENLSIKYSPKKGKYFHAIFKYFPFVYTLYSTFYTRVIVMSLPYKHQNPTTVAFTLTSDF